MTPTLFLIQIAILFLPGMIWAQLDARYAAKSKPTQVEFLLRSFLFGLSSYAVTFAIYTLAGREFIVANISGADKAIIINEKIVEQIFAATITGFTLSILWMFAINKKWLTRFLQKIGATNSFGDEDVWDFLLNSADKASYYVNVRDFDKKLTYSGFVSTFSETGRLRELVLNDADVYDFGGSLLFHTPRVYISFKAEGAHLEFPYEGEPEQERLEASK